MTEDFVPFELAKKLKEKGFPQHITEEAYIVDNYGEEEVEIGELLPIQLVPDYMDDVAAPTIPQVLKWLREEKRIYVDIRFNRYYQFYKYYVFTMSAESEDMYEECRINTYEQAALAGIEYALDNLI